MARKRNNSHNRHKSNPSMRNHTALLSLVLAIWLAAGQPAAAAGVEAGREPALTLTLSQGERGQGGATLSGHQPQVGRERGPVDVAIPQNRLEERLFADAAEGRLKEFSPFEAALVAGGVEDSDTLHRYQQKAAALVDQLRHSAALDGTPAQQAEAVFAFMHRHVLHGGYDLAYTDLRRVLDEGRFNCVSATVLFNYLAGEVGLECRGLEMPGHAMSRVVLADASLDIETTCPRWFRLTDDPKLQEAAAAKTIGTAAAADRSKAREVSPIQLAAMIYYNRGVDLLADKRFAEAAKANAKALRLDPQNATARGNLLATINNWSIELGASQHFAEAVDLLRQGLAMDAKFTAFAQNYVHVHHQWANHLCQTGHFEEALDILSRAAAEMPDRDYLRQAQNEVYERWAQVVDAPQAEPLLEMPCLMGASPVN
jgi:tetratricopeptide (TPR) repeat protein